MSVKIATIALVTTLTLAGSASPALGPIGGGATPQVSVCTLVPWLPMCR